MRSTYSLIGAPTGMTIDSSGRITWPTTATNIGDYSYQVVATNPYGLSVTSPSYPLDVTADTTPPTRAGRDFEQPGRPRTRWCTST